MKIHILFILSLFSVGTNVSAQIYHMINKFENISPNLLNRLAQMGLDGNLCLNELEGSFFNAISGIEKKTFNFYDKKVAFFTGNVGSIKSNKKNYFMDTRLVLNAIAYSDSCHFGTLYIFNAAQKEKSGGYDAAIVDISKKLLSIEEVIENLKRKEK